MMGNPTQISLRPYSGHLYFTRSKKVYEAAHKNLFKTADVINCAQAGRMSGGEGKDGIWTYLVYAETPETVAHEFSHVVLHLFDRCGLNPTEANGEPFCYLLGQLILDATPKRKKK